MVGGVQVDLPAFNRNQGNVETAAAAIRVSESNLAATQALIRAEVAVARADYEIRRQQVGALVFRMKAQAAENSRIALAAYREGGADLLRLLDAQRTRLDIEQLALRAQIEYRQSAAALELALGIAP
jgi:cobalt-zinc-cadmium efflux system outer membrane protein